VIHTPLPGFSSEIGPLVSHLWHSPGVLTWGLLPSCETGEGRHGNHVPMPSGIGTHPRLARS